MLYESVDLQHNERPFVSLKSFKKFGQEFSIIPVIISIKEGIEVFLTSTQAKVTLAIS